jgi:polysaccharide biosynthesis transport protein
MNALSAVSSESGAERSLEQTIAQARMYYRLAVSHKWEILVGTFALTLAFTVIIARLPSVYEATTTILVDPQQIPEKYVSAAVTSDPSTRLNTITQQVLSRTRLEEIMDKLNLYQERRKSASSEELIEEMRDDITIQVKQGSGPELSTFTITYQGKEPKLDAAVANELANSFIQWNIHSREQQVSGTKDFLSSELQAAKQNLVQQEDKLRQFKMSHLGEMPDQTAINLQALAGLRSALQANAEAMNRLDDERIVLTSLPEALLAGAAGKPNINLTQRGRLELEKRQLEETIEQLRGHYGERYPDLVRATRRLEDTNAQLNSLPADAIEHSPDTTREESTTAVRLEVIDNEMKRLKAEENHVQSQIEAYQTKVDATPIREQQLVELNRNYDISKQRYQNLLDKSFNIDMAADLEQKQKGERFTVLDPAQVPQKPVKPRRKLLIPLCSLAALGFSLLYVLARKTLSPSIQTEMDLKSLLPVGVRVMGHIPHIEIPSDTRRQRRWAISAFVVCVVLCLALIGVIWDIHQLL